MGWSHLWNRIVVCRLSYQADSLLLLSPELSRPKKAPDRADRRRGLVFRLRGLAGHCREPLERTLTRRGGLQEAPVCSTIVPWITAAPSGNNGYYDRYMAVVKLPVDPQDEPAFVGVLESNGWGVHSAKIWYSRNRE